MTYRQGLAQPAFRSWNIAVGVESVWLGIDRGVMRNCMRVCHDQGPDVVADISIYKNPVLKWTSKTLSPYPFGMNMFLYTSSFMDL
jgi:hypothetical protein